MTALTEFQRLEAAGAWRPAPGERLREVIVSVGDATLILSDPKSEAPLAHWSLPAVRRLNPGQTPAVYTPGLDMGDEHLEIDDPLMIDAIARVHRVIASRRAHPGRLRMGLTLAGMAAMIAAAALWLPGATTRHAAAIAPPAQASAIGASVLSDLARSTGAPCDRPSGQTVLRHLATRLIGPQARLHVVAQALDDAIRLPGDHFALGLPLIDTADGPDLMALYLLAAAQTHTTRQPLEQALDHAGLVASLRLMTSGQLPDDSLTGLGHTLLDAPRPTPDAQALAQTLARHGIDAAPYADRLRAAGHGALADAAAATPRPEVPLLSDQQWLALQQICD